MNTEILVDMVYILLFVVVGVAEYFHLVPMGTAFTVLVSFIAGQKTQQISITLKNGNGNGAGKNG